MNNAKELDIAQRVAEALTDKTEAIMADDAPVFDLEDETLLGEVPVHLRQLFLLIGELGRKAYACGMSYNEIVANAEDSPNDVTLRKINEAMRTFEHTKTQFELCKELFFTALFEHLPAKQDDAIMTSTSICQGWKVVSKDISRASICADDDTPSIALAVVIGSHNNEPVH